MTTDCAQISHIISVIFIALCRTFSALARATHSLFFGHLRVTFQRMTRMNRARTHDTFIFFWQEKNNRKE